MRTLLAGAIVAASLASIAPASAQSFEIGRDGPRSICGPRLSGNAITTGE